MVPKCITGSWAAQGSQAAKSATVGGGAWKGGVDCLDTAQDVRRTFSTGQFPNAVMQSL